MKLDNNNDREEYELIKKIIHDKYNEFEVDRIMAVFAKNIPAADVISLNKDRDKTTGKTSHIACTTKSMSFFYSVLGEIRVEEGLSNDRSNTFKVYVETKALDCYENNSDFEQSECTIWVFEKQTQRNQIGLSKKKYDGELFYKFRSSLNENDFIVFFKYLNENNEIELYVLALRYNDSTDKEMIEMITKKSNTPKYYEEIHEDEKIQIDFDGKGTNKIYYGAPGTGKSNYVNREYYNKGISKRVTFHPEYTYQDFIGSIKPYVEGENIKYGFKPGVFTDILVQALKNPKEMHNLIIEELNRANVSSVFGDLFQLLDRDLNGVSEYPINNAEIINYIRENYSEDYSEIRIPGNLNIIATMNTADQNVFVIDTAFKRRWEFEYIPIKFEETHGFKDNKIKHLNISWESFVEVINKYMMAEENSDLMIAEDKQIGPYFVNEYELEDINKFTYKVLLYLWDDVFRMDKERLFNSNIRTFTQVVEQINSINPLNVFNSNIASMLEKNLLIKEVVNSHEVNEQVEENEGILIE